MLRSLYLYFILCFFFCYADSMRIEKIEELDPLWEEIDSEALVIFDIDDVIFSTVDHFSHPYGYQKFLELTDKALAKCSTAEEKAEVMRKASLSQILAERVVVEEKTLEVIKDLQSRGIKVIALTNFPRGAYGVIECTETWRIEYLKQLGISFAAAFPDRTLSEFSEFIGEKGTPSFAEGILFSNGHPKGKVLCTFFEKSQFYPSRVVFIDDLIHHHKSVKAELHHLGIPFVSVHYLGASRLFNTLNEDVLTYQFNHLLQTEKWLTDNQVMTCLENSEIFTNFSAKSK